MRISTPLLAITALLFTSPHPTEAIPVLSTWTKWCQTSPYCRNNVVTNRVYMHFEPQGPNFNKCQLWHTRQRGEYCYEIAKKFHITLQEFYVWNPSVKNDCSQLYAGQAYCVYKPFPW
ncbi:hypothetical protein BJ508DRAFT_323947 [Ascobolus immersus RN42]|uniref:LysM domain-containing protein n=1 Tax=Ascobolus immersus RN42 TaxID=1160509 RepID=A0A3N4IIF2_ASCIM|nr:hypothetical protein BJ508DRAFT_323947 [Ascobolus immersus RN42]